MKIANENTNSYLKRYILEIGEIEIYDDFMLAQLNEGVTIDIDTIREIQSIGGTHFPKKPFAYITVRKNSYAVDPMIYFKIFKVENLKAIAIVSEKFIDVHNIKIEKHFYNKPMNIFKTLPEAITWVKSYL